jgi:hypothetical protein
MVRYVFRKGSQARKDASRPIQLSKTQAQQNAISRRDGARGLYNTLLAKGCRESRVPEHTRSLACEIKSTRVSTPQVCRKRPAFPAQWF